MKQMLTEITLSTTKSIEFIDITDRVRKVFAESKIHEGNVTIFSRHTTTAVKINERCERLQEDMEEILRKVVPKAAYRHNHSTVDGRDNAHSHLMSFLLNTSETIPATGGDLVLGTWQSIFFIELDGPRSNRTVIVKVMGE